MGITFKRVIIFCGDVNKLKTFYQEHFEFKLVEETKGEWVVLNAGPTKIAFHRIGAAHRSNDIPFRTESNT